MNPRPRVLHFVDSEEFGGAEQAILTLLEGMDRTQWDLVLAHYDAPAIAPLVQGAQSLGVETWPVPTMHPGVHGLSRVPSFAYQLRQWRPAVMHLHLTWPLGCQYAIAAAVAARVQAVVATLQLYVEVELSPRVMWQQRMLTRGVDRYFAVSQDSRQKLIRDLHWPAEKIEVVHNAVWTRPHLVTPPVGLREGIVGDLTTPLVLVPARLHEQKGHPYLLQAIVDLPNVHFALAGEGPERAALEQLARELGVTERVSFLGYRNDVSDLLTACDLVVLPSLYEGLPVSLLEAMAARRPVIATRIGGTDELIDSGRTGLLVEPRDPAALVVAIRSLIDDPERARQLADRACGVVNTEFSAATMSGRVSEVYGELLAS